ncbi:SARP family transcriptional regulator [Planobispora rosea]|uniref:SARP family transcriptional regulator n=1 Tax=Planobispora rosea TaxID=35762 RepID=A0A8J3RZ01_PLARO|nr:BTAD domain-containing putative transcriptional regulator [Planobispora rosea]GGS50172.1 SARP family transcriptional regulator [Planobispora rosea]GIH83895.1 SARP family transcriptional regulator [Planobispora rosea]
MEFRVLGPVDICRDGRSIAIVGPKQRTLLALLVLQTNRVVSHDRMLTALWGGQVPATGRRLLHNHLWSLRRLLAEPQALVSSPTGYSLKLQPGASDLDVFLSETARARSALDAGDPLQASSRFREALSLWRGPALDGTQPEFQIAEGATLEELRLAALICRAEADLTLGRHSELVSELRLLVTEHPLNEGLRGQLMRALHGVGRTAEALDEFRSARVLLRDELGLDPGEELIRIHQAILSGDSAVLSGVSEPTTKTRAVDIPRQLPADVFRFTGRAESLLRLDRLLSEDTAGTAVVISAIAGAGGVGKTALATHWGHRAAARFPDGQLYINLHGYSQGRPTTAAQALDHLLRSLGVSGEEIPHGLDERAALYRSLLASRRLLIVLDNAANAEQVRCLLPGSTASRVVITSRDSLRGLSVTHDVHSVVLDVLSLGEAVTLLTSLLGADRTGKERDAVTNLARLCGCLPLALRLAAAQLATHPALRIADFTTRLERENRLSVLDLEEDPHIGVRSALELSYRSLPPEARRTLRLIGMHPGPDISLEAVAALSASSYEEARGNVDVLINAHLLQLDNDRRLSMHDLVRVHAQERSQVDDTQDDRESALARVFNWYAHTARAAMRHLNRDAKLLKLDTPAPPAGVSEFTEYGQASEWLETERLNLVAVINRTATSGWPVLSWQLTHLIAYFFYLKDYVDDWVHTHQIALSAARSIGDQRAEAMLLSTLGHAHMAASQLSEFIECQRQSLKLSMAISDQAGEANALCYLGYGLVSAGSFAEAEEVLLQAHDLYQKLDNQGGVLVVLLDLATVYLHVGRTADSVSLLEVCSARWREQKRDHDEAFALLHLSEARARSGDTVTALEECRRALELGRGIGNARIEVRSLIGIGSIHWREGDHAKALDCHQTALALSLELSGRQLEGEALQGLADTYRAIGENLAAQEHYRTALEIAIEAGRRYRQGYAHNGLALALHALGRVEEAVDHWKQALALFTDMGVPEAAVVDALLRRAGR